MSDTAAAPGTGISFVGYVPVYQWRDKNDWDVTAMGQVVFPSEAAARKIPKGPFVPDGMKVIGVAEARFNMPKQKDAKTINPESELVARLREFAKPGFWPFTPVRLENSNTRPILEGVTKLQEVPESTKILLSEAADTIERLASAHEKAVAAEREKFTMHTAHVHAWFSALLQELGIAKEGDQTDVATACSKAMDVVIRLRAQSTSAHEQGRREGIAWAVLGSDGIIDARTVAPEPRGAKVNWLFAAENIFVQRGMTDERIERMWESVSAEKGVQLVQVAIRALSPAPPPEKGERIPSGWKSC